MKNDETAFAELMATLSTAFPKDANLTKLNIDLYYTMLQDITIAQLRQNVLYLINTRKYPTFPTIAEVRDPMSEIDKRLQSEKAWLQVLLKITEVGPWDKPIFDDLRIMQAIDTLGGWEALCNIRTDQVKWKGIQFSSAYRLLSTDHTFDKLTGPSESKDKSKDVLKSIANKSFLLR